MANHYDISGRTACMRNAWEHRDDHIVIYLPRRGDCPAVECLIDTEDLPLAQLFTWGVSRLRNGKHEYCSAVEQVRCEDGAKYAKVLMHRLIMQSRNPNCRKIDHINGDTLDNRKRNLRVATGTINALNKHTGYKPVKWGRGFAANISFKYHSVPLGNYDTERDALIAHNAAKTALIASEQINHKLALSGDSDDALPVIG